MHDQGLFYVSEIIRIEHTSYFGIETTQELIARKEPQACSYYQYLSISENIPNWAIKNIKQRLSSTFNPQINWLTKMVHSKPAQMIDAPELAEIFIDLIVWHSIPQPPQLNCTSRLSFHLQILVPPIPFSSSTTVTTHASSMKTLIRNLMTACRKNLQRYLVT